MLALGLSLPLAQTPGNTTPGGSNEVLLLADGTSGLLLADGSSFLILTP
ncbi:hypothetical protein [Prosthecobacter sp.]|nr:hypothetical protein [Prosthecobacter sp.]MDI1314818.1 hypothetical protein [Prosthecobacter sp.]